MYRLFFQDPKALKDDNINIDDKQPPITIDEPPQPTSERLADVEKWVKLAILSEETPEPFKLVVFPIIIGRRRADITIDDPAVSRRHAMIDLQNGVLSITDTNSKGGVGIDEGWIDPGVAYQLFADDVFVIGSTEIKIIDFAGNTDETPNEDHIEEQAMPGDNEETETPPSWEELAAIIDNDLPEEIPVKEKTTETTLIEKLDSKIFAPKIKSTLTELLMTPDTALFNTPLFIDMLNEKPPKKNKPDEPQEEDESPQTDDTAPLSDEELSKLMDMLSTTEYLLNNEDVLHQEHALPEAPEIKDEVPPEPSEEEEKIVPEARQTSTRPRKFRRNMSKGLQRRFEKMESEPPELLQPEEAPNPNPIDDLIDLTPEILTVDEEPPQIEPPHVDLKRDDYIDEQSVEQFLEALIESSPIPPIKEKPTTAICSKCGKTNKKSDKFCGKCGNPQKKDPPKTKVFCDKCGAKTNERMSFCGKCGNMLN